MVITRPVASEDVEVGDIIRYRLGDTVVLRCAIALAQDHGELQFVTRNDAAVPASALDGRVPLRRLYVGWASIAVRAAIEALR